jgi:ribosomal protein L14E/L6E/L27E
MQLVVPGVIFENADSLVVVLKILDEKFFIILTDFRA